MLLKLALVIAAIAILITLGTIAVKQSGRGTPSVQDKDSLVEIARRKKAEGQDKASVSGLIIDYAGAGIELDDALNKFSVLVAEPIESKSFALGPTRIHTWHRFRILETLSGKSYCAACSIPVASVPQELRQPNHDEFFVGISGGVLNIEGVQITQPYSELHFETGNKYLMFVNLAPSQVAFVVGGPSGVLQLDKNDTLHSLSKENAPLPAEMRKRFGLKLSQFKSHINR